MQLLCQTKIALINPKKLPGGIEKAGGWACVFVPCLPHKG
ncbi:hypothetical protein ASZ90_019211 [hydrocarbon metagenome]|uniref:Uncharacterized protein n=1 Tax=hydrocarbon metagenome TaxID=938273 RepID=A0A0W8E452_9ZZZZ